MAESFPMSGGEGPYSYTKNSQFQKQASDFAKRMIREAIIEKLDTKLLLSISTTFRIVDLGCSVGPSTFYTVQDLIETVVKKCSMQGIKTKDIEFQVYFNDHTGNDFNTLFASLPTDQEQSYYAAGVPGSFYGRLFPRASVSLAHSSHALHWLSKVPEVVSDSKSPAWNEGKIHYSGSPRQVVNAYADQFEKDMGVFLSARAEELVGGGLMVLNVPGIPEGGCHPQSVIFNFVGSALMDMSREGIVDKAKIDAFNLPIYFPTAAEMRKAVEKNGYFNIETLVLTNSPSGFVDAHSMIMRVRSAMGGIFVKHFGDVAIEKLSETLAKNEEFSHFFESGGFNLVDLFVVLKHI